MLYTADWSDHYIEYEKLKSILKKGKAAQERYDDLAAKKPNAAANIRLLYKAGVVTPLQTPARTPHASKEDLQAFERQQLAAIATGATDGAGADKGPLSPAQSLITGSSSRIPLDRIREEASRSDSQLNDTADGDNNNGAQETTELVSAQHQPVPTNYGSSEGSGIADGKENTKDFHHSTDSSGSFISLALEKAASGVTDYFSKSYERQIRDCLKELEKYCQEFDECLTVSIARVNAFYNTELQGLDERLSVLKESVASTRSTADQLAAPSPEEHNPFNGDDLETPLVRNRKRPTTSAFVQGVQGIAIKAVAKVSDRLSMVNSDMRRLSAMQSSSEEVLAMEDDEEPPSDAAQQKKIKEAESIQRALVDQYRSAKLLLNFAIMNYTGFVKIVKKHDKSVPQNKGHYKEAIKPVSICNEGKAVEALADRMERLYANWFCDRNVSEARAQMLPKRGDGLEMDWSQLRLGYRMGMCSILGLWVCWDCVWGLVRNGKTTIGGRTAFPVFRATGGLVLLQWFWGCSVWVWTRYRINYIYLFDFNPHIVESPLSIFNRAVDNTLFFLVNMLLYYKAGTHDVPGKFPAGIFPFALVVYSVYHLIFPLRTRMPMWQTIWGVITAPMNSPSFFHGYVGDIFTSMVKIFQDMLWTFFFVFSGDWMISEDLKEASRHEWSRSTLYSNILIPLLTLLPLWFRFNQCLRRYTDTGKRFPHLANAFKYALSQTVTLFGAFHPLYLGYKQRPTGFDIFQFFWVTVFVSSSLYSFVWDVTQDWGLGLPKYGFLGPRLMFPQKYGYFVVIGLDLVLRFAWVLTLVPPESGASFGLPEYMTAVSLMLELFRRTIWGFLRLENEHRSNASGFRRVDFVPLHFSTGHLHEYKQEKEHRGFSVLIEVAVVTLLVLAACTVSVVMAQHATEKMKSGEL